MTEPRTKFVVPVYPQCGHFSLQSRGHHQCPSRALLAVVDNDEDGVCGTFCTEHAEAVHNQLVCYDGPRWRLVPIFRGNPRTGKCEEPS